MKLRRPRWAWNIFCALSLLILATSVTLWVRSYFVNDSIVRWSTLPASTQQPGLNRTIVYGMGWPWGSIGIGRVRYEDQPQQGWRNGVETQPTDARSLCHLAAVRG